VKSISPALVSFSSYEQIDPDSEFYFSQKTYRVTQQCSGLRMLLKQNILLMLQSLLNFCLVFFAADVHSILCCCLIFSFISVNNFIL